MADQLGIRHILIHPFSGILSAYGMGLADIKATTQFAVGKILRAETLKDIQEKCASLRQDLLAKLALQGVSAQLSRTNFIAHLKYRGTDSTIAVAVSDDITMQEKFEAIHQQRFGFVETAVEIVIEFVEITAVGGGYQPAEQTISPSDSPPVKRDTTKFFAEGQWQRADIYHRDDLRPGHQIVGPAVIIEPIGTIILEPGWHLRLFPNGMIQLTRHISQSAQIPLDQGRDPVMLEVFNNLFMSIAEQMGITLQNTARSVNIKERLDFSCAIFDPDGT